MQLTSMSIINMRRDLSVRFEAATRQWLAAGPPIAGCTTRMSRICSRCGMLRSDWTRSSAAATPAAADLKALAD